MRPADRTSRLRGKSTRPAAPRAAAPTGAPHANATGLRGLLHAIDGGPFQAYRRILGEHELGEFRLSVQSVPPDALGGPARLRLSIDRNRAGLDGAWSRDALARAVIEDAVVRSAWRAIEELTGTSSAAAPGSGRLAIDPPGPDVVERTTARLGDEAVDVALSFELPAEGRRVRGRQAESVLFDLLPRIGMATLLFPARRVGELKSRIAELEKRRAATEALRARGLAMVVPFPAEKDIAVPTGITLFVSTGVAGAGAWLRERTLGAGDRAGPVAVIRAARHRFGPLDLRAFVRPCPEVPRPEAYQAEDAPAPLRIAASLVEAVEAGARLLVLDEDELPASVLGGGGPAHPLRGQPQELIRLTERLAELRDLWGVSFFVAARQDSSLFEAADNVFMLRGDAIEDAGDALRTARRTAGRRQSLSVPPPLALPSPRSMRVDAGRAPAPLKVAAWGGRGIRVGEDLIDLSDTELAHEPAQLRAIAALLKLAATKVPSWRPVEDVLNELEAACSRPALDRLEEPGLVDLARPSRLAIAGALARWKRVAFRVDAGTLRPNAEDLP